MTKKELTEWKDKNSGKYPELNLFCEKIIDGVLFYILPVKYGIYNGVYFCFADKDNAAVQRLRAENNAVGVVENYGIIKKLLSETVRKLKSKKWNAKNKTKNITDL